MKKVMIEEAVFGKEKEIGRIPFERKRELPLEVLALKEEPLPFTIAPQEEYEAYKRWMEEKMNPPVQASLGILKDKGFTFEDFLKERQRERQKEIEKESKGI